MANKKRLKIIEQGVEIWNKWRKGNQRVPRPDLREANLSDSDLIDADLTGAIFGVANLTGADLTRANITGANFQNMPQ